MMKYIGVPLVSVIIANYNNSKYLSACIDSVLDQSHGNVELVIVDDASTDESLNLIRSYNKGNENIKLIVLGENSGVQVARDVGIKKSKGDYITTLDADDIYYSRDKIRKELEVVNSIHNKDVIAFSDVMLLKSNSFFCKRVSKTREVIEGDIFKYMFCRSAFIPRDFLFTRSMYDEVGGFDKNIFMYEDWDLKIRLSRKYSFYYTGEVGVGYRRHGKGLSSADLSLHQMYMEKIVRKNYSLIRDDELEAILYNITPELSLALKSCIK